MKLREDVNLVDFVRQIKNCKSDVYLETEEADILNLRSVLSQYVFVVLAKQKDILRGARVMCRREEDYQILAEYLQKC